jgi:hypothetical protein
LSLRTSGGFVLSLDTSAGTLSMTGLAADFLAGGPVTLPVSAQVSILDAFRTRNPDSLFPAASANTSLGDATLTALGASQVEGPATGSLTPVGPGQYSFTLTPTIALAATAQFSGTELELPPTPVSLTLSGQITLDGDSAAVTGSAALELNFTDPADTPLEPFPFDLPTVFPAGSTAHVILNLTLDQLTTVVDGTQAVSASGVNITRPGDADLNGIIDIRDYLAIDRGRALTLAGWTNGDFTGDGAIDGQDYDVIDRAFLAQRAGPGGPVAALPEPGTIAACGAAALLLLRGNRRAQARWRLR